MPGAYCGVDDDFFVYAGVGGVAPLQAQVGGAVVGDARHLVVLDVDAKHLCMVRRIEFRAVVAG